MFNCFPHLLAIQSATFLEFLPSLKQLFFSRNGQETKISALKRTSLSEVGTTLASSVCLNAMDKLCVFASQRAFSNDSGRSVTSPRRVIDIDRLVLRSPLLRYWEAWMAAENSASGDRLVQRSHKQHTQYTHKEDNREPCRRFYCIFQGYDCRTSSNTQVLEFMCSFRLRLCLGVGMFSLAFEPFVPG